MMEASLAAEPSLQGRFVSLEPLSDAHREPLRAACAADPDIWAIYPWSMLGEHFDAWWLRTCAPESTWTQYVVIQEGKVIGMTGFGPERGPGVALIGATYFHPEARGGVANPESKLLLLDRIFAAGTRRAVFNVDPINPRSRAAMNKLGAVEEGVTRQASVTWTGRVRDLVVFSILSIEWPAVREALVARIARTQGT